MKIVVRGVVQGVGFRPTVQRIATSMGLSGYVQNDGSSVVIVVDRDAEDLVRRLKESLPILARIDSVEISATKGIVSSKKNEFKIVRSRTGQRGVSIPNDVALCEGCRTELFEKGNRRHMYPFINCTDCGARFTVIGDLPYDRINTSMEAFEMCKECRTEYEHPSDRRFHHQTISCPKCGPRYYFLDREGKRIEGDPIRSFSEQIHKGAIGVAKSWGGMHICCNIKALPRLRRWYNRKEKPFAVMFRDLSALESYAEPSDFERRLLTYPNRPVVLIRKKDSSITELISPGLGSVGAFLPYTAMHHILFHHLPEDALVMTSANVPGEPMMLRDEDALSLNAECYLLHDREIVNRCDDSVLRTFDDKTYFLRKSRGHIPSSIDLPINGDAVGLGAQENITGTVGHNGKLFQTQHIGDGSSAGVVEFLESSLKYQKRLLGANAVQAIGVDLHPGYSTRKLGRKLAEEWGSNLIEVQHHWAHAASLMVDAHLNEVVALTLDGTGYGDDGTSWGGEVLRADLDGFERVGHLQNIPLVGGDMAVKEPRRLVFAISELVGSETDYYDEKEAEILRKMIRRSPVTSSFGRVLDALSCYFDICCARTYDGEPAMKLERYMDEGKRTFEFELQRDSDTILTLPLFEQLFKMKDRPVDAIHSFVYALLSGLVDIACDEADDSGLETIGLTGGVSYNYAVSKITRRLVTEKGFEFVCHDNIPNGDGGISTGQCAIALSSEVG